MPVSFRVYIRVIRYPNECWHPLYFKFLTAGFGEVLFADDANSSGPDRSNLRLVLRCYDPTIIPPSVTLHYQNNWTSCPISIIGWEFGGGGPPEDFDGPISAGTMEESRLETEVPYHDRGGDVQIRQQMADAFWRLSATVGHMHSGSGELGFWEIFSVDLCRPTRLKAASAGPKQQHK